jgi:DDE superfamily endonuclease
LQEQLRQAPGEDAQLAVAPTPQGPPPSRWSLKAVRASVPWLQHLSLSGVWRVLQRCGLRLRSARLRQYSPDPEYTAKEAQLLACLGATAGDPGAVALVFIDEMGYYRWPDAAAVWSPRAPQPAVPTAPAGPNNKQWRVIGALNALTGQVDYLENYMVGRRQLIQFYGQLDQRYGHVERLYVVQDNWSIHQHPDVLAALAELPRITPVWLPTYAPWLNPIEKLWRWLRQDQLYVHRLAHDWSVLRQRVKAFFDQFAAGSHALLRYVGLLGEGKLARALQPI